MMKQKLFTIPKRAVMTLLLAVFTITSTWADSWPKYITEVVLFGIRSKDKDYYLDHDYVDQGYTVIKQDLIKGCFPYCDVNIYIAYKTDERASIDGGYITDFVVLNTDEPPSTWKYNGRTYHLSPSDDHLDQPFIDFDGNLNFGVTTGWNLYLYYTKDDFDDKRVVSGISFNDTQSGSVDCYEVSDKEWVYDIDLNKGAGGDYIYMHLTTETKTNRPKTDPAGRDGLKYNGYYQHLMTGGEIESGEMYYQVDESHIFLPGINTATAQNAGTYKVSYYAGANEHGDQSETHSESVTIGKSPNDHATISCGPTIVGDTPLPSVTENLSKGEITYLYSSTEDGEYSATAPSSVGTWWVKATIAADDNCDEYTTAPVSFSMTTANLDFADNADNSSTIDSHNGEFVAATLDGRTLYKDGRWNTLCLPFDVALEGSPLEGAKLKTLNTTSLAGGTLTMNFKDATSIEAGKPYIIKWEKKADFVISSYADWNALCIVTKTHNLAGKTVVLTADVNGNVCEVMGASDCPFKGTIDGQGHTLTFNFSSEGDCCAPFAYVEDATIKNLHVDGTITANHQFAGGIVGNSSGNTTISNCRSSVKLKSTIDGDGTHGGLVGFVSNGVLNINDCLFDGKLSGNKTTNCGGFVGWVESNKYASVNFNRCLFNPAEVDLAGGCKTFARSRQDASVNIYKGFYETLLGEAQGTDASNMPPVQLGLALGTNWELIGSKFVPKMNIGAGDLTSPLFSGVTIDKTLTNVETEYADFIGNYAPVDIAGEDKSMLYFGANNKLYYPNAAMTIKAFRAYFRLKGIDAGHVAFGGDDPTGINVVESGKLKVESSADAWYDLQGRRLSSKPSRAGVYIKNGKLIVIK
jgi:hypothetical protein